MKKFISKIFLFSLLFFVFDKVFLIVRYFAPTLEVDKRLEVLLQGKMDADLLIFGSSIGATGIIATELSNDLNIKAYNLSYPGSNIDFHEYLLKQLLQNGNKKPKTVLLAVDEASELIENKSINFRFERLYPLVKYPKVRSEMIKRGEKNKILSELFVLYQLNKSNFDLRKRHFTLHDSIMPCGSMPTYAITNNFPSIYPLNNSNYNKSKESKLLLSKFKSFIDLCLNNEIQLVLVYPPKYKSRNKSFEKRIYEIAENKVRYFTFDDENLIYRDKTYYNDASHLRTNGAIIFSRDIVVYLKMQKLVQ